jgi:hypothetical protein
MVIKLAPGVAAAIFLLQACGERSSGDAGGGDDQAETGPVAPATDGQTMDDGSGGGKDDDSGDGASSQGRDDGGSGAPRSEAGTTGPNGTLSERYPGDVNIASDPAVLFHDDFESGWGRWDGPTADTRYLTLLTDESLARAGRRLLRSRVTTADLQATEYISSSTYVDFDRRVDEIYWRFYARFPELAPNPHHWVRMAAGNASWSASGRANTVPPGDQGFWFDFDASNDDQFNFYVYWYKMRSGRCNDGTVTPGCAGDQGTTYYYGNVFEPPGQQAFPRDRWFCIEIHAKASTPGASDGELAFWIDDRRVGEYRPGTPEGTWLRAQFHTGGCTFSACTPPQPFAGFDFRSSSEVRFKSIILDAYYERTSSANKRQELERRGLTLSDAQTILYDDVVAATERIGCAR